MFSPVSLYIKEAVEKKYSVAQLRERIRERKKGTGAEYIS